MDFIGKKFDYSEYNKNTTNAYLWYNSLKDIDIQKLFRPFFENMDREIENALEKNLRAVQINFPKNCYIQTEKTILNEYESYKKYNRNNFFSFFSYNCDMNIYSICNEFKPFYIKNTSESSSGYPVLFIYNDFYFNLVRNKENEKSSYNIQPNLSIDFIEHLFHINSYNFKEIIHDKIKNVKEIDFKENSIYIRFY